MKNLNYGNDPYEFLGWRILDLRWEHTSALKKEHAWAAKAYFGTDDGGK